LSAPDIAPLGEELLDDPAADQAVVARSLRNIARANRWFGGVAAVTAGLAATVGDLAAGSTLTLLDIGTGLGDLPRAAVRWGSRRGVSIVPLGIERNPTAARLATGAGVPTSVGCAGALPVRSRGADVVLVSQVLHHLATDAAVTLLRECDRIARRGVIVADLRRSGTAARLFALGALALGFDPVTRADGVTSVRRGYSEDELRALLRRAEVPGRVVRRPGFRLLATWRIPSA
jgi:2-polyprenyl-3-methyl-5-hydroxy-6-metoxy-1,4-benzoquinol methylase